MWEELKELLRFCPHFCLFPGGLLAGFLSDRGHVSRKGMFSSRENSARSVSDLSKILEQKDKLWDILHVKNWYRIYYEHNDIENWQSELKWIKVIE